MSAPAESPPAADDAPSASKPAKSVPLALLLAVLVGLAAGGGAGAFAVGPLLAAGIAPMVQASAAAAKDHTPKKGGHGDAAEGEDAAHEGEAGDDAAEGEEDGGEEEAAGEGGGHGEKGAATASVYTLDNLVLNPAGSDGTRFLLLTISFQVKSAATVDQMKERDAELRDAVLVTVGNRTVEQLADVAVRDSLKGELKAAARKLFRKGVVKRVYFPQFVIQ